MHLAYGLHSQPKMSDAWGYLFVRGSLTPDEALTSCQCHLRMPQLTETPPIVQARFVLTLDSYWTQGTWVTRSAGSWPGRVSVSVPYRCAGIVFRMKRPSGCDEPGLERSMSTSRRSSRSKERQPIFLLNSLTAYLCPRGH